jgi:hypothetical protein
MNVFGLKQSGMIRKRIRPPYQGYILLSIVKVEAVLQFYKAVIPGEPDDFVRDPWFDRLTTLSEVEGESRRIV